MLIVYLGFREEDRFSLAVSWFLESKCKSKYENFIDGKIFKFFVIKLYFWHFSLDFQLSACFLYPTSDTKMLSNVALSFACCLQTNFSFQKG